jgi:uncharacterized protein YbdZ (MbtH family)
MTTRAEPIEFASRQCGALFSGYLISPFYGGHSTYLSKDAAGLPIQSVPVIKSPKLKAAEGKFHAELYSQLASRYLWKHSIHSFCFDEINDPWNALIGDRSGMPLAKLAKRWSNLGDVDSSASDAYDYFHFLGGAFGGNRKSQLAHLKHMFQQSLNAPGYHSNNLGEAHKHFDKLIRAAEQDETKCHILFNALEQRMSLVVLGDMITKTFGFAANFNKRCRDWSEGKWYEMAPTSIKELTNYVWGRIIANIPPMGMPYGRNLDPHKELFKVLSGPTRYIASALIMRCPAAGGRLEAAIDEISECKFFLFIFVN